jgi:hypothetical protein
MDVVEDQEQRVLARPELEQGDDRLEETELRLSRVAPDCRCGSFAELREHLGQLRHHRAEVGAHGGRVLLGQAVPDRFDERQVREWELGLRAASPEDVAAQLARPPLELAGQARLSDAGLT